MLDNALIVATAMLAMAMLLCIYRLWRGPDLRDRVLALDALYLTSIALLLVQDMRFDTAFYIDVALLIAGLGFVGTAVAAKYLQGGRLTD